ncbi:hypothetical protein XBO1_1040002 [Xenorhabdus bovienii str. oregonense]|uniref:Uncharacterized protein n=1 Tax=Xenorhabdus bovienii str. oregonense TaxID=1398202 RepID=A0A077P082_XENBV|nr:hypothetical protein XBO1_1040002 [Xenorhabdus bovienii str. oregonense]
MGKSSRLINWERCFRSAFSYSFHVTDFLYANYRKSSTWYCWGSTYASNPWADK